MASLPLACPRCATRYPLDERFCAECGMPLTYAGRVDVEQEPARASARARRARSSPSTRAATLRQVATARQQAEAEFIQMLLLEEGVPSTLRRIGRVRRSRHAGRRAARRAGAGVGLGGRP